MEKRILLLDPDVAVRGEMAELLAGYGLNVLTAGTAREMERILHDTQAHLVMLDMLLPDASGLSVCARLKALTPPPAIIIVSDSAEECDVVVGLEIGADDYITKPFRPRELLARVKAVLRRFEDERPDDTVAGTPSIYRFSGWRFNTVTHELFDPRGAPVNLSTAEFLVLWTLVSKPREVHTRDQLRQGPPDAHARAAPRQVNVAISRLRSKLDRVDGGGQMIRTIRHVGYTFAAPVECVMG